MDSGYAWLLQDAGKSFGARRRCRSYWLSLASGHLATLTTGDGIINQCCQLGKRGGYDC